MIGCGGDDGPGAGADCGFPTGADSYFPFEPGYRWTFRVTDLGSGVQSQKPQAVSPAPVTDDEDFPGVSLLEQVTDKPNGQTISLLAREGDVLVRYKQEDYDAFGTLERVTVYDPPKIRLDEGRAAAGTTFEESYTATETDALGVVTTTAITESWEVIGVDVPCSAPFGELECLQVRRIRTAGGTATKDFYYARGVGKIREEGDQQIEELVDCAPQ